MVTRGAYVTTMCGSRKLLTPSVAMKMVMVAIVSSMLLMLAEGESCGKRVTYLNARTSMELLTTPNYPNDYDNNEHCQWVISALLPSHVVQIESVATDLINWDDGQCEDFLAVYDGLDNTKPLLKKWCGKERVVLQSSNKALLLVFHTDSHLTDKGFAIKYYSVEKFSSKCDPDNTITLETTFNPLYIDLPSYSPNADTYVDRVTCRYLLTNGRDDAGQLLSLELHSAIKCSHGNFSIYDGPDESSPRILSWCYGTDPFDVITTTRPQVLVTFTLLRPSRDWHVLRVRALARSRKAGCSDSSVPTLQVSSKPTFISFPYTTSIQGSEPCSVRLWSKERFQTLRLDVVNADSDNVRCDDQGIEFYDGYSVFTGAERLGQACHDSTVHSSTHHLLVTPGAQFSVDKPVILRVVALEYPCNNDTETRTADNDGVETLPSLKTGDHIAYPNDAVCRYLLSSSPLSGDVVEVEVRGRMVARNDYTCQGDYITFYDGPNTTSPVLEKWCGASSGRLTLTSTGPDLLVVVVTDQHDNLYDGFSMDYYAVPGKGRCRRGMVLDVNTTLQTLTSPNYPRYYPINSYCDWLLRAGEGEVVVVKVTKSDMDGDCTDMVLVYDGKEKSKENSLGRWCASETPQFKSTGRHLLLIFTANDRRNAPGFELQYFIDSDSVSQASVWTIVGSLFGAIVVIIIIVVIILVYLRHWQKEQHKI